MNTRTVHRLCVLLRYRDGGSNLPPSLTDRSKVKNDLHLSHLMHYMNKTSRHSGCERKHRNKDKENANKYKMLVKTFTFVIFSSEDDAQYIHLWIPFFFFAFAFAGFHCNFIISRLKGEITSFAHTNEHS